MGDDVGDWIYKLYWGSEETFGLKISVAYSCLKVQGVLIGLSLEEFQHLVARGKGKPAKQTEDKQPQKLRETWKVWCNGSQVTTSQKEE